MQTRRAFPRIGRVPRSAPLVATLALLTLSPIPGISLPATATETGRSDAPSPTVPRRSETAAPRHAHPLVQVRSRTGGFDHALTRAYLAWAARLQRDGMWAQAEHLTVKGLAAQRGDRPAPTLLVDATLGAQGAALRRASSQLSRHLLAHPSGGGGGATRTLAEAQAAFDCWAMAVMDDGTSAVIRACRDATREALARLPRSKGAERQASAI